MKKVFTSLFALILVLTFVSCAGIAQTEAERRQIAENYVADIFDGESTWLYEKKISDGVFYEYFDCPVRENDPVCVRIKITDDFGFEQSLHYDCDYIFSLYPDEEKEIYESSLAKSFVEYAAVPKTHERFYTLSGTAKGWYDEDGTDSSLTEESIKEYFFKDYFYNPPSSTTAERNDTDVYFAVRGEGTSVSDINSMESLFYLLEKSKIYVNGKVCFASDSFTVDFDDLTEDDFTGDSLKEFSKVYTFYMDTDSGIAYIYK